ncbi:MAG: hypothetical protein RQ899_09895, partial [Pseudomonadales bacterium]|nr:hypothetical protein [Pseudomonadales bacterium]
MIGLFKKILLRLLLIPLLLLAVLLFAVLLTLRTESGSRWLLREAMDYYSTNTGDRLELGRVSGSLLYGLHLEQFSYAAAPASGSGAGTAEFSIGSLDFSWRPEALLASELRVQSLQLRDVTVNILNDDLTNPAPAPDIPQVLDSVLRLPWHIRLAAVQLEQARITLDGQQFAVAELGFDARLGGGELRLDRLRLAAAGFELDSELRLLAEGLAISASGQWRLRSTAQNFAGEYEIGGNLESLNLSHRLTAPLLVTSKGTLQPGLLEQTPPQFALVHDFGNVLALLPELAPVQSLSGRLNSSGSPERVLLSAELELELAGLEPFSLTLNADYADAALHLAAIDIRNSLLALRASAVLDLQPDIAGNIDWQLQRLDLSRNEIPGFSLREASGEGSLDFSLPDSGFSASLQLRQLAGQLNDYPLSLQGDLEIGPKGLEDIRLAVSLEDSTLALAGSASEQLALSWNLNIPTLPAVLPGLSGRLQGEGLLGGSRAAPEFSGRLDGDDLKYVLAGNEYSLQQLRLEAGHAGSINNITLKLSGLGLPVGDEVYRVDDSAVTLVGTPQQHELGLAIRAAELSVDLRGNGRFAANSWAAALDRATIRSAYGDWQLQDSLALTVSGEQAAYERHCWEFEQIQLCSAGTWRAAGGLAANLEIAGFPLAYFNDSEIAPELKTGPDSVKPPGFMRLQQAYAVSPGKDARIDGTLAMKIALSDFFNDKSKPGLDADVSMENVSIGLLFGRDDDTQDFQPELNVFHIDKPSLHVTLADANWQLASSFEVYEQDETNQNLDLQGFFDGQLSLAPDDSIAGEFSLDFDDIAWLEAFLPDLRASHGQLKARARVNGNPGRPLFLADVQLQDAGFSLPEYGLDISALNVHLNSDANNEMTLSGSARSGAGSLTLTSQIHTPFLPQRNLSLDLVGENVQIVNRTDSQVAVSPDLSLTLSDAGLDFQGRVDIPLLFLDLRGGNELINTSTSVSD